MIHLLLLLLSCWSIRICDYFTDRATEILIEDVRYNTFLSLMEYLYTDDLAIDVVENMNAIMDLFQVSMPKN